MDSRARRIRSAALEVGRGEGTVRGKQGDQGWVREGGREGQLSV